MGGHTVRRPAERAGTPMPADDATLRAEGEGAGAETGMSGEGSSGAGTPAPAQSRSRTEAAHRRAAQRAARISAGTEELEQRLADLLRGGLAGAEQAGYALWEEIAARMVDSQAPGLAARVRELGSVAGSGEGWPERLLAECALLHLLARAWEGRDTLPRPLAETVRTRVGLTVETSELLADGDALIRDEWLVLAQRDTEEGRLTARRIWLYGRGTGRSAMLLSFAAGGRAPEPALPVGAALDADVAYYPGGSPLRVALGERHGAPMPGFPPAGGSIPEALETYAHALHGDPWLEGWPYVLRDVVPIPPPEGGASATGPAQPRPRTATGWQLASAGADVALPLAPGTSPRALWKLLAMSADGPLTVFGECGHHGFTPHTAWLGSRPVTL
ncbi:SWIM zinc finger family protein [Streptomyces diacarni]|uniref:SWIM zinc finger family protein n=1 Tax=Streptomyces diacarni TaxID=2800381 RepID=A0A367ERD1_9ACTN|nr:SWIM zinc finger family protein [Streptomyces diacarni]RCG20644.1 SWIM zinc finger family protein [Streptomyces diacarni]